MDLTFSLQEAGLSKREASTYCALLEGGSLTAAQVSKVTGEARPNTYDTLGQLMKKGLVGVVSSKGSRLYLAAPPNALSAFAYSKVREAQEMQETVLSLLPKLENLQKKESSDTVKVEVFQGAQAIRPLLDRTIRTCAQTGKEFLVFRGIAGLLRANDPAYHKEYYRQREKLGIRSRYLLVSEESHLNAPHSQYRYLPATYKAFVATSVHGNEVSYWLMTNPMTVIVISSEKFANSQREDFEFLWRLSSKEPQVRSEGTKKRKMERK